MKQGLLTSMLCVLGGLMMSASAHPEQPGVMHTHAATQVKTSLHYIVHSKQVQLTTANKPIYVKADNPIVSVTLSSNRTTGYRWFLMKLNRRLIKPVSAVFAGPANKKLMGAPGTVTWTFKVKKAAFTVPRIMKVRLLYARPWDLSSAESKVITLVVG